MLAKRYLARMDSKLKLNCMSREINDNGIANIQVVARQ
jgi:hypothetical protein